MAGAAFDRPRRPDDQSEAALDAWRSLYQLAGWFNGDSQWQRIANLTGTADDDDAILTVENQGAGAHLVVPGLFSVSGDGTEVTDLTASGTLTVNGAIVGSSTIQGTRLISTVATGTAPLTVSSTTVVANLNADMVDGQHGPFLNQAAGDARYLQLTGGTIAGSLDVDGSLSVNTNLDVDGTSTLGNTVTIEAGGLSVTGSAAFNNAAQFNSDVDIQGVVDIDNNVDIDGSLTVHDGTVVFENSGNERFESNSTGLGFFGSTPIARPTVVGARDDPEGALATLLEELANLGLISDLTTAS